LLDTVSLQNVQKCYMTYKHTELAVL